MTDIETEVRRGLARYSDAMPVSRPPLDELLSRPVAGRPSSVPTYVLAGVAVASLAAGGVGVSLLRDSPDEVVTGAAPVNEGDCAPSRPAEGVVAAGDLDDGRPWQVKVTGASPDVGLWPVVDGSQAGGWSSDDLSWPGTVNNGTLYGTVYAFGEEQILYGEVPNSTATVEVRLSDGESLHLCPVAVPAVREISYFGAHLPGEPEIMEVVVLDHGGVVLARGEPARERLEEGGDGQQYGINLRVDAERVDLPLGGKEWPLGDALDNHLAPVISGSVPSGEWSVLTAGDGTELMVAVSMPGKIGHSGVSGTPEQIFRDLNWMVESVDGRHIVSGPTPETIATVVVTLDDGQTVEIPTEPSGLPQFDIRVFGAALPEGASITAIEGLGDDGTVLLEGVMVTGDGVEVLDYVADFDPEGAGILVQPPE